MGRAPGATGSVTKLAAALLAGILVAGCAPPGETTAADLPRLWLDADPSSDTFGAVAVGPVAGLGTLAPDDRAAFEAGLAEASFERFAPLVVWTGTVVVDATGACVHPQGQATVLGSLRASGDRVLFAPRLGWVPGVAYTACADLDALARPITEQARVARQPSILTLAFTPADMAAEAPRVVSVWPATATVPENLLRVYLGFSEPMVERDVAGRVHLLDATGEVVPDAFVDIPNGLWDARSTRLTLFLHPGRIKRGVGPHRELGPALVAGSVVTLRVDGELASQRGVSLGRAFERRYRVGPADRAAPDPERWRLVVPNATDAPLTVVFDEPVDRYQLLRFVAVHTGAECEPLRGAAVASEDGLTWTFTPAGGWPSGSFRVVVQRAIEDLAGNTVDRLFDVETQVDDGAAPTSEVVAPGSGGEVELPFAVRW
ncbi:MAG TPA: hypothetical protein VNB06_03265 [Thermoanaerobaculia bacterium]|nr:hypothetical protein [Thermoanaerobaculia bacterium]